MHTVRSLLYWGLPDRDPLDRDPLPWTETPSPGQRPPPPGQRPHIQRPPGQRPPGQRSPWTETPPPSLDRDPPPWIDKHLWKHFLRKLRLRAVTTILTFVVKLNCTDFRINMLFWLTIFKNLKNKSGFADDVSIYCCSCSVNWCNCRVARTPIWCPKRWNTSVCIYIFVLWLWDYGVILRLFSNMISYTL